MRTKFYKNEKFQAVFFPVLYFLLTISIVVTGCYIFYKKYYQPIVVDGSSMQPTLIGGGSCPGVPGTSYRYNYGVADLHNPAINGLKRFDVVVTYYPSSWMGGADKTYKIKRVWGFPGETIDLKYDTQEQYFTFTVTHAFDGNNKTFKSSVISSITKTYEIEHMEAKKRVIEKHEVTFQAAKFSVGSKSFFINASGNKRTLDEYTLGKNEYFVMGDNWASSTDCWEKRTSPDKLTRSYIQGRVLYISAYVSLKNGDPVDFHNFKKRYYF